METRYVSPGIESLEYWLPDSVIRNEDLAAEFTDNLTDRKSVV